MELLYFVISFMIGVFLSRLYYKSSIPSPSAISAVFNNQECKMVLLIRTDLEMTKGKVVAQACHATLHNYQMSLEKNPKMLKQWEATGQAKITLKISSEDELMQLHKKATGLGLVSGYIRDAGRTQIQPGSKTVLAIGPAPKGLIDEVTGHLKLY